MAPQIKVWCVHWLHLDTARPIQPKDSDGKSWFEIEAKKRPVFVWGRDRVENGTQWYIVTKLTSHPGKSALSSYVRIGDVLGMNVTSFADRHLARYPENLVVCGKDKRPKETLIEGAWALAITKILSHNLMGYGLRDGF